MFCLNNYACRVKYMHSNSKCGFTSYLLCTRKNIHVRGNFLSGIIKRTKTLPVVSEQKFMHSAHSKREKKTLL